LRSTGTTVASAVATSFSAPDARVNIGRHHGQCATWTHDVGAAERDHRHGKCRIPLQIGLSADAEDPQAGRQLRQFGADKTYEALRKRTGGAKGKFTSP
jgi:hypothetical protein